MIEQLREVHKIGKDGPIALERGHVLIETAFGKTHPQVAFNSYLFQDLILRWIMLCTSRAVSSQTRAESGLSPSSLGVPRAGSGLLGTGLLAARTGVHELTRL